jgi:hypothetical protein
MRYDDMNHLYFLYNPDAIDETGKREVVLKYIPDKVSYSYSPNYSPQDLLGRLSPIMVYSGGSPRKYSFSITYHKDMVGNLYGSLINLVDMVKSLSYPERSQEGIVSMPRVYFQLGEISGTGIVQTSVSWKKPYDMSGGSYALVEISFDITVEELFGSPVFEDVEIPTGDIPNFSYTYRISPRVSYDEAVEMSKHFMYMGNSDFSYSIVDLINFPEKNNQVINAAISSVLKEYDFQRGRLERIHGVFLDLDGNDFSDTGLFENIFGIKTREAIESAYGEDARKDMIYKTKVEFRDYLDEYRDDHPDMTDAQYNAILEDVFRVLNNMEELAREVIEYGKSS